VYETTDKLQSLGFWGVFMVRFYRKLIRNNKGYHAISVPLEAASALSLEEGGMVALDVTRGRIVITRAVMVQ
jgi:hypothetical protein